MVSYCLGQIGPGADIYLPKLLKVMKDSGVGITLLCDVQCIKESLN